MNGVTEWGASTSIALKNAEDESAERQSRHFRFAAANTSLTGKLRRRELGIAKPGTQVYQTRQFYLDVCPTKTVRDVTVPDALCIKRFSPDGERLLCFRYPQRTIVVYKFHWPVWSFDEANPEPKLSFDRKKAFAKFFSHEFELHVVPNDSRFMLHRDIHFFVNDGRHLVLASFAVSADPTQQAMVPELVNSVPLEDYVIHIVDTHAGVVTDTLEFRSDCIQLGHHNCGLYVRDSMLAVLSIQYQTIHLYDITAHGKLVALRKVGPFCHEDDELLLLEMAQVPRRPQAALPIASLKHRLLSYMLRQAQHQSRVEGTPRAVRHFLAQFAELERLCMHKLQIIDERELLIRFTTAQSLEKPTTDMSMHNAFFVVYNMQTTEIVGVYENASDVFLERVLQCSDALFRGAYDDPRPFVTAFSNNAYMMELVRNQYYTYSRARNGGHLQAIKKLLARLPLTTQSYSASPLLDPSLFSYDEKCVSPMAHRAFMAVDVEARFYARRSGSLKFRLNITSEDDPPLRKPYAHYVLHPHLPLVITMQYSPTNHLANTNLHFPDPCD